MQLSTVLLYTVLVLAASASVDSVRVLGVFAHPATSNALFCHSVMSLLAARGHHVTVYSLYPPKPQPNLHHVHVFPEVFSKKINYEDFVAGFVMKTRFANRILRTIAYKKSKAFLEHELVQKLLTSNETFDVVFTGAAFGEEALLVFGHIFKAPTISLMPSAPWNVVNDMAGNDLAISYIPDYFAYEFTDKMSFLERIQNFLSVTVNLLVYHYYDLPAQDSLIRRYAPGGSPPPPPVQDMVRDVSLTMANFHPNIDYPRPLPPNIVPIGGIHINEEDLPLPKDIQEWLDGAVAGAVYFSLGTVVPVESMPAQLVQQLVAVFSRLPQRVLWKMSLDAVKQLPPNVKAASWLPQQSVLAHSRVVLFVTHGGLGSQLEALRAGVPVIGIPFFSDQPYNVRLYSQLGVGEPLYLNTLSERTVEAAIHKVLSNQSYTENAKRVSRIYRDRPQSAATTAVFWTEYVVRHGGARHLRPQAALLPWHQRFLLDLAAATLSAVLAIAAICWAVLARLCRRRTIQVSHVKKKN